MKAPMSRSLRLVEKRRALYTDPSKRKASTDAAAAAAAPAAATAEMTASATVTGAAPTTGLEIYVDDEDEGGEVNAEDKKHEDAIDMNDPTVDGLLDWANNLDEMELSMELDF